MSNCARSHHRPPGALLFGAYHFATATVGRTKPRFWQNEANLYLKETVTAFWPNEANATFVRSYRVEPTDCRKYFRSGGGWSFLVGMIVPSPLLK